METANGTKTTMKAMVSSLIPNTDPKRLNISMMAIISRLLTPTFRKKACCCIRWVFSRKSQMPRLMASVSFITQKAPPIIRMKTMMLEVRSNPLKKAVKTCHVCGAGSTRW